METKLDVFTIRNAIVLIAMKFLRIMLQQIPNFVTKNSEFSKRIFKTNSVHKRRGDNVV